jgi:hypothetical protein
MHISRNTYKGLVDNKAILLLLILEFLKESRLPKTKMEIRNHLLEEPENLILTPNKGTDANSVDNYLKALELKGLIVRKGKRGSAILWSLTEELKKQDAIEVKGESIAKLKSLKTMLDRYNYFPFIFDLNDWINANQGHINDLSEQHNTGKIIVGFDAVQNFTGQEHIATLYDSIEDQTEINFEYESFSLGAKNKSAIKEYTNFRPHLLKEHGNRWYVVGNFTSNGKYFTFGVDRIKDWIPGDEPKFERDSIDPNELWKHSLGIYTSWEDGNGNWSSNPEKVSFKVKNGKRYNNIDYLVSDPIHASQTPKDLTPEMIDKDGYVEFELEVFLDSDLVRKLRSIGIHNLKDIKPDMLEEWVNEL